MCVYAPEAKCFRGAVVAFPGKSVYTGENDQRRTDMLYAIFAAVGLGLLGLDQWLKHWITVNLPLGETMPLLPGFLQLRTVHNYGAAWSSFSGQRWLLVAVTCCIVAAVSAALIRRVVRHPLGLAAGTLIISGGLGNIIDRVRLGYVVDMLDFQFMNYPVFNLADCCIVCGCILGAVYYLWLYEKYDKKEEIHGDSDAPSE